MKKIFKLILLLTTSLSLHLQANFNFGECSGSGTFEQQIVHYDGDYENTATVGTIPEGIQGLRIELISDKDVDIRLYGENDDKIVHWPYGLHYEFMQTTKPYNDVNVTYSGYNGVDGKKGHEFIEVDGTTPTSMTMKAFGYQAGYARVNYSWSGKDQCTPKPSGTGNFTQTLEQNVTSLVGTIPSNVDNIHIKLTSETDLDIQLYGEDGTAIVSWKPTGLLAGATKQSILYNDMNITWSGYNGIDGIRGHEYISITPQTTEVLTMKVFGYVAGSANVVYSWGAPTINIRPLKKTGQSISYETFDDGYYQVGTDINYSRDDSKEVVTDHATGLMWQDNSDATSVKKYADAAIIYCDNLVLGGYDDWRLPHINELQTLVDFSKSNPATNSIFEHVVSSFYWSSTVNPLNGDVWMIGFIFTDRDSYYKSMRFHVRCTRTAQ